MPLHAPLASEQERPRRRADTTTRITARIKVKAPLRVLPEEIDADCVKDHEASTLQFREGRRAGSRVLAACPRGQLRRFDGQPQLTGRGAEVVHALEYRNNLWTWP
jgi:hypothetical protein